MVTENYHCEYDARDDVAQKFISMAVTGKKYTQNYCYWHTEQLVECGCKNASTRKCGMFMSSIPYSGYFLRGLYFADFAERAQFANFETSKFNH